MASTSAPRLLGVLQRMGSSDQGSNSLKAAAVAVLLRPLGVTITEAPIFSWSGIDPGTRPQFPVCGAPLRRAYGDPWDFFNLSPQPTASSGPKRPIDFCEGNRPPSLVT